MKIKLRKGNGWPVEIKCRSRPVKIKSFWPSYGPVKIKLEWLSLRACDFKSGRSLYRIIDFKLGRFYFRPVKIKSGLLCFGPMKIKLGLRTDRPIKIKHSFGPIKIKSFWSRFGPFKTKLCWPSFRPMKVKLLWPTFGPVRIKSLWPSFRPVNFKSGRGTYRPASFKSGQNSFGPVNSKSGQFCFGPREMKIQACFGPRTKIKLNRPRLRTNFKWWGYGPVKIKSGRGICWPAGFKSGRYRESAGFSFGQKKQPAVFKLRPVLKHRPVTAGQFSIGPVMAGYGILLAGRSELKLMRWILGLIGQETGRENLAGQNGIGPRDWPESPLRGKAARIKCRSIGRKNHFQTGQPALVGAATFYILFTQKGVDKCPARCYNSLTEREK